MNINRHNYEEFFLLYVDNELSAAERNAVELFVQENADLKEELSMLKQTVITSDTVVFGNKNSLLKEEVTALQENLLLYLDDELSVVDKLNTEKLLKADSAANKELSLLQQTKLQPDAAIVFADKKLLYRREGAKVVGMPWRRIAAAAMLLGFGIWAGISILKPGSKTTAPDIASVTETKITVPQQVTTNTVEPVISVQQNTDKSNSVTVSDTNDGKEQPATKNNGVANTNVLQQKEDNNIAQEIKKPNDNLPNSDYNNFNNNRSNEIIAANVKPLNTVIDNKKPEVDIIDAAISKKSNPEVNGYALNANFTEGDEGQNQTDENGKKKTKLGGFFRKVKRLVDRNTNVETGNGVKIAGFDIAIK